MSKLIQKAKRPARFALPIISGFAVISFLGGTALLIRRKQ